MLEGIAPLSRETIGPPASAISHLALPAGGTTPPGSEHLGHLWLEFKLLFFVPPFSTNP